MILADRLRSVGGFGGGLELTYDSYSVVSTSPTTIPANTEAGDLLICMVGNSTNASSYPSGFTGIGTSSGSYIGGGESTVYTTVSSSYRIAQSGDAGSSVSSPYGGRMFVFLVKASKPISTVTVQDYTSMFTTSTVINAGSTNKACVTAAGVYGSSTSPYYTATYSDVNADRFELNGDIKAFNAKAGADNTYTMVNGSNSQDGHHAFYLEVE